jgi:hypothetical protein
MKRVRQEAGGYKWRSRVTCAVFVFGLLLFVSHNATSTMEETAKSCETFTDLCGVGVAA